jgi:hypothetical protein
MKDYAPLHRVIYDMSGFMKLENVDVKKWLRVAFGLLGYDTVQFHRWL